MDWNKLAQSPAWQQQLDEAGQQSKRKQAATAAQIAQIAPSNRPPLPYDLTQADEVPFGSPVKLPALAGADAAPTGWAAMGNPGPMIPAADPGAQAWANGPAAKAFDKILAQGNPAVKIPAPPDPAEMGRQFQAFQSQMPRNYLGVDINDTAGYDQRFNQQALQAFAQQQQAAGDDQRLALQGQQVAQQGRLGMGELAAKGQRLGLETELGRGKLSQEAQDLALRKMLGIGQLDLGNKEAANKVQMSREGNATELEKARVTGEYGIKKSAADTKGAQDTLTHQQRIQMASLPPEEAEAQMKALDAIQQRQKEISGRGDRGGGVPMDPAIRKMLGLPAEEAQLAAPQVGGGAAVVGGGAAQTPGEKKLEAVAQTRANTMPTDAFESGVLGIVRQKDRNGMPMPVDYSELKKRGVSGVANQLAQMDLSRVSPAQVKSIFREMSNAGMKPEEILTGLGKGYIKNARDLGDSGGKYKYSSGEDPRGTFFAPATITNPLTLRGPDGSAVMRGSENAGLMHIPQFLNGNLSLLPTWTGEGVKVAKNQRAALERMLDEAMAQQDMQNR